MEELKFTKLSEVPVVEELTDGDYVMAVQNGEIVRISKNEIGGGTEKRELIAEWNFTPEDDVREIVHAIDDNFSWMTKRSSIYIEAETYNMEYNEDEGYCNINTSMKFADHPDYFGTVENYPMDGATTIYADVGGGYVEFYNLLACLYIRMSFYTNMGMHESTGEPIPAENNTVICAFAEETAFKSLRIYKVTK